MRDRKFAASQKQIFGQHALVPTIEQTSRHDSYFVEAHLLSVVANCKIKKGNSNKQVFFSF